MTEWRKDEPPKDGNQFLADVGLPWPVVAAWNGCDECYVYANLQCGMVGGIYIDTYFENEQEKTVKQWAEMPGLKS
jgi:hypothetical protein